MPPRYGSFNDTPLRVEVHPSPQVIDFHIEGANIEVKLIGTPGK